jgi:hypothetical protein
LPGDLPVWISQQFVWLVVVFVTAAVLVNTVNVAVNSSTLVTSVNSSVDVDTTTWKPRHVHTNTAAGYDGINT